MQVCNYAAILKHSFQHTGDPNSCVRWVLWHQEDGMTTVLNVDGSSLGNPGASRFGGVLRRSNGDWLLGYYGSVGVSDSLHVELLALYHGLLIAWQYDYKDLVCYTNSTLVVQLVHRETNVWHHYAAIINNIKDLLARNWRVRVIHTLREANSVADYLAKQGAMQNAAWVELSDPPTEVTHSLQSDASRALIARS